MAMLRLLRDQNLFRFRSQKKETWSIEGNVSLAQRRSVTEILKDYPKTDSSVYFLFFSWYWGFVFCLLCCLWWAFYFNELSLGSWPFGYPFLIRAFHKIVRCDDLLQSGNKVDFLLRIPYLLAPPEKECQWTTSLSKRIRHSQMKQCSRILSRGLRGNEFGFRKWRVKTVSNLELDIHQILVQLEWLGEVSLCYWSSFWQWIIVRWDFDNVLINSKRSVDDRRIIDSRKNYQRNIWSWSLMREDKAIDLNNSQRSFK
jgi:hypothetical protein